MNRKYYLLVALLALFNIGVLNAATIYVNNQTGDDSYNGSSPNVGTAPIGPKKTIRGAVNVAQQNDNIVLAAGVYNESCTFTFSLNFITNGTVQIKTIRMDGANKTINFIGFRLEMLDTLELKQGKVDVSTGIEFVIKPTCRVLGGSATSYIDGPLHFENTITGKRNLFFPIGNKKDYRPVLLNINQQSTTLNTYKAELYNLPLPHSSVANGINRVSNEHYWTISKFGSSAVTNMELTVSYDSTSNNDEVFDAKFLRVLHDSSSTLNNLGGIASVNHTGKVLVQLGKEVWGNFTLGNAIGGINALGHTTPFSRFGSNGVCEGAPVQLLDSSFCTEAITDYYWEINHGQTGSKSSTVRNPTFVFDVSGNVPVFLRVTNSLGEKDSIVRNVFIRSKAKNNFTVNNPCLGDTSFFQNTTQSKDSVYAWYWNINGAFNNKKNPVLVILKPDTSVVRLISTTIYNCKDTLVQKVAIHNKPKVDFDFNKTCLGDTTFFANNTTIFNGQVQNWNWVVNQQPRSNLRDFTTVFKQAGVYTIHLRASTDKGCFDTLSQKLIVNDYPTPLFNLRSISGNNPVQCYGNNSFKLASVSQNSNPEKLIHRWKTQDQKNSNDSLFSTNFAGSGKFWVRLIVRNSSGCTDSIQREFEVLPPPSVDFTSVAPCFPDSVSFNPTFQTPKDTLRRLQWFMGDGMSFAPIKPFKYKYDSKGDYTVKVVLLTQHGCIDSIEKTITIQGSPDAKINAQKLATCQGDSVLLTASGGNSYTWLPDGQTSPTIFVSKTGKYVLRAASSSSCFGFDSVDFVVHQLPTADAGEDTAVVLGKSIVLQASGGDQYVWLPPTYLSDHTIPNPECSASSPTTYTVEVTDQNGCKDSDSLFVDVREPEEIKIVNLLSPNGDGSNDTWELSDLPELYKYNIKVVNKSGQTVFESTDYHNDWDGTFRGRPLPEGSYFYFINCKCGPAGRSFKGNLLILR